MSKMYFLLTNFQKSPNAEGSLLPVSLNLRLCWRNASWFGQIVVFQLILTNEL